MKIEWASHFDSNGRRRSPPPSTMHGWLAKMRGTLVGNEELRSKGMSEMRQAKAARIRAKREGRGAQKRQQKHSARTGRSLFSFLGFGHSSQSKQPNRLQSRRRPEAEPTMPGHYPLKKPARPPIRPSLRPSHRSSRKDSSRSQPNARPNNQRRSSRR